MMKLLPSMVVETRKAPDGMKYELREAYHGQTAVMGHDVENLLSGAVLQSDGSLSLPAGYRWNGPSGPTVDTPATLMPSALHDELYAQITQGLLPADERRYADLTYRNSLKNWGVSWLRRMTHFKAVRHVGWLYVRRDPRIQEVKKL